MSKQIESNDSAEIIAPPASIQTSDRETLLRALLEDLTTTWADWSQESRSTGSLRSSLLAAEDLLVHLLALTSVKCLGRSPAGSGPLSTDSGLLILLYHSALPVEGPSRSGSDPSQGVADLWSHLDSEARQRPPFGSEASSESLKILANTLLMHEKARQRFASIGGARSIADALAPQRTGWDRIDGSSESSGAKTARYMEQLFLLGRIGFLVSLEQPDVVQTAVDKGDIVNSLCHVSCLKGDSKEPSQYEC